MNPYVVIGAVLILAVSHGYAFVKGQGWNDAKWQAKVDAQKDKARETEQIWQGAYNEASKTYLNTIAGVRSRLDVALNGLRDRPDRPVPGTPRADCKGATGAELSKQDGSFLEWEAARADRQRAALKACYTAVDSLR